MSAVGAIIVLLFVAAALWVAAVNPWRAIRAAVFVAPWGALYIDIGLWVNAYQIIIFALLVMTFLRSLYSDWRPRKIPASGFLLAMLLYALLTSLIQIGFIPQVAIDLRDGPLRGPSARAVVQMFMFMFTFSPALLVAWYFERPDQAREVLRTYLWSVAILAALGWVQLLVWYGTGKNPMPIGFVNIALGGSDIDVREGIFSLGKLSVYRMNSFAGEPRHLGGALVLGMMIVQAIATTQKTVSRGRLLILWLYFAFSTFATLSTSALLMWTVGSILQFPIARVFGVKLQMSGLRIFSGIAALLIPFALIFAAIEASGFPLYDIISARTVERIDANGAVEDFDLAIYGFFADHPERLPAGLGLGNAHLYARPYIDPEFQWYALGRVFTAKVQYLRFVSEIGIIGLALFLTWVLALLIETSRAVRHPRLAGMTTALAIATLIVTMYLVSGQYTGEFMITAGILGGMCAIVPRRTTRAAAVPVRV